MGGLYNHIWDQCPPKIFSILNLLVPYYHYLLLKGTLSLKNGLILDY